VADELPQRQIHLDEFWIDQTEVTNAQFAQFVAVTGYVTSAEQGTHQTSYVFDAGIADFKYNSSADWKHPHGSASNIAGLDDTAVTQVSWEDAEAYCAWAGRRLPTEAEWEKAARGTDGRLFVWGNQPPNSRLLNFNLTSTGPQPVGSFPAGISQHGSYDMAGNVWEWVSDFYGEEYYESAPDRNPSGPTAGEGYVFRGGSWASEYKDMYLVTTTARLWNYSYVSSDVLGIRCATSTP
jgi:formylglycine-generating enzyme required for sulfatase activity